jgi:hypothetical protein
MRAFLIALSAALLLTGCSGGSSKNNSGAASVSRGDAAQPAPARTDQGGGDTSAGKAPPGKAEQVRLAPAQAVVYTANLTMRTGDVDGAAARAKQIVIAAGGYVGDETSSNITGAHPSSDITFKIPSVKYQGILDQLASSRIGARTSLRQQAEDVTGEVADVGSRVKSADATLASFRKLLAKANSVEEVISVEQEISGREADLESLQARQKSLSAETAYATVTLRLEGTSAAPAASHHKRASGFGHGVATGWDAFTAFMGGVFLVVGWLLPFLGLALLVGLPALWVWRRRRTPAAETGEPDAT